MPRVGGVDIPGTESTDLAVSLRLLSSLVSSPPWPLLPYPVRSPFPGAPRRLWRRCLFSRLSAFPSSDPLLLCYSSRRSAFPIMSMSPMSTYLQPFTPNSTIKYSLRSTNVSYSRDFIKLLPIGRTSGHWATNFIPNSASRPETTGGHDCTVGENDGVIIVDHGSRRQESNLMLNHFVSMFRERTRYNIVEPAHMELAEPSIKEAFGKCVQQGASRIIVSPYFLSPGRHWNKDIPSLASEASKEHSNVPYIITAPLGLHELMVDIMNDRIKYCLRHVAGDVDECTVCSGTGKCRFYS